MSAEDPSKLNYPVFLYSRDEEKKKIPKQSWKCMQKKKNKSMQSEQLNSSQLT